MDYKQMLRDGVNVDGFQFCLDALQEECAELVVAIAHLRRGRITEKNLIEEMADVQIMLDMCRVGFDDELGFDIEIKSKAEVLGNRISFKKEHAHARGEKKKGNKFMITLPEGKENA